MVSEAPKFVVVTYYAPPEREQPIVNVYGPFDTRAKGQAYARKQVRKYKREDEDKRSDMPIVSPYLKFFVRHYIDVNSLGMQ